MAQYLDSTGLFKEVIVSLRATPAEQERVRLSEQTNAGMARKVAGVKMAPPAKRQAQIEQIRRLKGGGMSNYAIGKAMGCSASTVAKYISAAQPFA